MVPTCKETCEVANIGPFVKRQCGTALDLLSILLNLRASLSQTTAYVNQHNAAGTMWRWPVSYHHPRPVLVTAMRQHRISCEGFHCM